MRDFKGHSLIDFVPDYIIIDIETTGLDPSKDSIIELAALKVHEFEIVDSFSTLVNPDFSIDPFITNLTGIKDADVEDAPSIDTAIVDFYNFIGDSVVIGHNVNFDINFIYDNLASVSPGCYFSNNYIDTLSFSRKYFKSAPSYKLTSLADFLKISVDTAHRALDDCYTTNQLYLKLYEVSNLTLPSEFDLLKTLSFDENNPFYNKRIVVKGQPQNYSFSFMKKVSEMCHAKMSDVFYRSCDYIVFSKYTYAYYLRGCNADKYLKAQELSDSGTLKILSENEWCEMLGLPLLTAVKEKYPSVSAKDITTENTDFDETHPVYEKTFVFTGALEHMTRKEAMQIVVDYGGNVGNSVTKKTNFLVLGNNDYCPSIKDGKSSKQKKAEALKLEGNDIEIISENVFYDMIADS